MTFPSIGEYKTAVRNADGRFATLRVVPELNEDGQPLFLAGNFAAVFKASVNDGETPTAVKCFTRGLPGVEKRHAALVEHLQRSEARYMLDVGFFPDEVFVQSKTAPSGEYPVVTMPWVEGETLGNVIARFCKSKNAKGLAALTRAWAGMCLEMLGAGIAHGDLKHDNVLVTSDGRMLLIDYDSMFVPALKGMRAVLLGGANFQHPRRTSEDFDRTLDHFSILVISLSMRALTLDPTLLEKFNTSENIILSRRDFLAPKRSPLFTRLRESPCALIQDWTERLQKACEARTIDVPGIERVLKRARKAGEEPEEGGIGRFLPFSLGGRSK